jgi:hypothetical protein
VVKEGDGKSLTYFERAGTEPEFHPYVQFAKRMGGVEYQRQGSEEQRSSEVAMDGTD